MDSELLVILVVTTPIWVLVGVAYLERYLLKRKFKPDEEYPKEIKEIDKIRIFPFVNSIIAFTVIIIQPFNKKIALLLIPIVIIEVIRNKYILNYLKTKNESTNTRKYILYDLCFQAIIVIVALGYYFLLKTTTYFINKLLAF